MNTPNSSSTSEKQPWFLKSKPRLFFALFLLVAIPTAVLTLLVSVHVRKELREQAIQQNLLTAQLVASSVGEEFYNLRQYVENFAVRWTIIDSVATKNIGQLQAKLSEMLAQNPKLSRVFVTDPEGNLITDFPATPNLAGRNFAERDWYTGAAGQPDAYVSAIYSRTNVDSASVLTVCTRITDRRKKTIGFLAGQLTTAELAQWLEKVIPTSSHEIFLVDQNQRPALRDADARKTNLIPRVEAKLAENQGWFFISNSQSNEFLSSYARVPSIGWAALSLQPSQSIFAPLNTLLTTIGFFFLVSLAVIGLLVFYWFNTVSKYEARREQAEAELKTYATNLKRSNEELQALCYSIAHDLRGPLRAVSGLAIALKEDCTSQLDETGLDYVNRLNSSAQRMDELTKALLDYGRLSHVELNLEAVALEKIVDHVLALFHEEIQSKNAQVIVRKPLPVVRGNPVVLEQVFGNIFSNALKFLKAGVTPQVEIWAESNDKTALLRIRDNGIGIDPSHHKRIFGVFERLHDYQSFPGTGIGLAIVQKGVERIGGRIGVESKVGEGSCFWIELPKV